MFADGLVTQVAKACFSRNDIDIDFPEYTGHNATKVYTLLKSKWSCLKVFVTIITEV